MKRPIRAIIAFTGVLAGAGLAACSPPEQETVEAETEAAPAVSAWGQPPRIDAVRRDGASLVVNGSAGARSRVVLRGSDGSAVAANTDGSGQFELRLAAFNGDVFLTPEVQQGEESSASPDVLVVIGGGAGPIALLSAGEPARRLDGSGDLDAVDADGEVLLASGRATAQPPRVSIGGMNASVTVADGRWRATVPGRGATTVSVNGRAFAYPGAGGTGAYSIDRAGEGWRVTWPTPPMGAQTTWLPDRAR